MIKKLFGKKKKRVNHSARNAQRAQGVQAFDYIEGLRNTKERIRIPYSSASREPVTGYERTELLEMGRYLYANDGIVKGAIDDMARYATPLIPQADSGDPSWNNEAEKIFNDWSYTADIHRRVDFYDLQRMASVCIDRDGDVGMLLVKDPTGGYAIQLVESDRITDHPQTGTQFSQGVKLNKQGTPISYCVTDDSKRGYSVVSASMMSLFLEPERAQQTRGLSSISHAVAHIRDKKDILTFEKQGVKNLSSFSAVLQSEFDEVDEDAFGLSEIEETDANGDSTEITVSQLQSGAIPVLRKGEELKSFQGNRPSTTFQGFLEFLVREFAVGIGLPYEFVWNTSGLTGPSQRFVMGKAQRKFDQRQRLLCPFVKKSWLMVIGDAISSGRIRAIDGWEKCRIQYPAKLTIDVGRESQQEREDVANGLMSRQEHYGRRGLDWQTALEQQKSEVNTLISTAKEIADANELSISDVLPLLSTAQGVSQAQPIDEPINQQPLNNDE